jgi:hypothetical protein
MYQISMLPGIRETPLIPLLPATVQVGANENWAQSGGLGDTLKIVSPSVLRLTDIRVVVLVKSVSSQVVGSVVGVVTLLVVAEYAMPDIVTSGVKSVNAVEVGDTCGLWFSIMNSAACPTVMQLGVVGLTEQRGSAFTDQHGEPFASVQLKNAPVL